MQVPILSADNQSSLLGKEKLPPIDVNVYLSSFVDAIVERKLGWAIIALLLSLTAAAAGAGAFKFSGHTVDNYSPTHYLESYKGYKVFEDRFSGFLTEDVEAIVITNNNKGESVLTEISESMWNEINDTLSVYPILSLESYWRFQASNITTLATNYLSFDQKTALIAIRVDFRFGTDSLISKGLDLVNSLNDKYEKAGYDVVMTGKLTTTQISDKKTGKGFATTDGSGLPVIGIIFWWQVGSIRLLLLPLVALACSLLCAWALGNAIATHGNEIPSYQPNIMLFLCMALSIDYTFFLLTRFQEERRSGRDMRDSVKMMLQHSGGIVMVSGSILVVTWFALCFFPVYGLNAVGYCSAITIFMCISMNLLLTPCLLLSFEKFFSNASQYAREDLAACHACCCSCFAKRDLESQASTTSGNYLKLPRVSKVSLKKKSFYRRVATVATRFPYSIVIPVIVYALFGLGCIKLADFSFALGANISFGTGKEADAYKNTLSDFPTGGYLSSFGVLVTTSAKAGATVYNDAVFQTSCALAEKILDVDRLAPFSLQGIAFSLSPSFPSSSSSKPKVVCLDSTTAASWANGTSPNLPEAEAFRWINSRKTDPTQTVTLITFDPDYNPYVTATKKVVHHIRHAIKQVENDLKTADLGVELYLFHPMVTEVDAETFAIDRFPAVLTGTLLLSFSLVALRFRAVFVPFKLCFTIVVPILFVFGLAVLVFQNGALNFLKYDPLSSVDGISWLVPCATVFLLIGLALDYDIFLFSRVYELRCTGLSTRQSIITAVEITGPVISGAGLIMALAFTGMIVSSNKFLNQQGFIMIIGVLIDTYIVRVLLVPTVLSVGDVLNWWPVKMPSVRIDDNSDSI